MTHDFGLGSFNNLLGGLFGGTVSHLSHNLPLMMVVAHLPPSFASPDLANLLGPGPLVTPHIQTCLEKPSQQWSMKNSGAQVVPVMSR